MITKITFLQNYRSFKTNDQFEFISGINLLVGDQGVGKSSLLNLIKNYNKYKDIVVIDCNKLIKTASLDFEKDNVRIKDRIIGNTKFTIASNFSSHEECNNAILNNTALSIRSICKLVEKLKKVSNSKQIIASVHNPYLIQ